MRSRCRRWPVASGVDGAGRCSGPWRRADIAIRIAPSTQDEIEIDEKSSSRLGPPSYVTGVELVMDGRHHWRRTTSLALIKTGCSGGSAAARASFAEAPIIVSYRNFRKSRMLDELHEVETPNSSLAQRNGRGRQVDKDAGMILRRKAKR